MRQSGREYFFVSRDEFERMIRDDEFLEYAEVFGNYYGTAKSYLREANARGHDLLLDIDVQGAAQVKRRVPDAVSIFILPPRARNWSAACAAAAKPTTNCSATAGRQRAPLQYRGDHPAPPANRLP